MRAGVKVRTVAWEYSPVAYRVASNLVVSLRLLRLAKDQMRLPEADMLQLHSLWGRVQNHSY